MELPCPQYQKSLKQVEREHIELVLISVGFNLVHAAQVLQIGRSTLYRKMKEYETERKARGA